MLCVCLIKGIPNIYNEFVVWFMSGCLIFQVQKKWLFVIEEDRGDFGSFYEEVCCTNECLFGEG